MKKVMFIAVSALFLILAAFVNAYSETTPQPSNEGKTISSLAVKNNRGYQQ